MNHAQNERNSADAAAEQLSYVLVTPYTVAKSRTGGVLARLLLRLDLELVGAQMIAPDEALIAEYSRLLEEQKDPANPWASKLLSDYVKNNLAPSGGRKHRTLLLLFRGKDPCRKLSDVCGALYAKNRSIESTTGETIRDTYADLILDPEDPQRVSYFEPAVLSPRTQDVADSNLRMFADWLPSQHPIVENITYPDPEKIEKTLVVLKPDNWMHASSKPGAVIDMFSKTGVRIVGIKIHQMSVTEAQEFYRPLRASLREKFSRTIGRKAADLLEKKFSVPLSDASVEALSESFGKAYAEDQFQQVIEFMSGRRPDACPPEEIDVPGSVKTMLLIYEGENAQKKIREVLGPTDPLKAPSGTIRREFGSNIMVNAAHASNSVENAAREMDVLKVTENCCASIIRDYLSSAEPDLYRA